MIRKLSKFSIIFTFLFYSSCGIRVQDESFDNIFPGTWDVTSIQCFKNGVSVENYPTSSVGRVIRFTFENKSFTYTVVEPSNPPTTNGCSLNMTGQYSTLYTSATNGIASMFNIANSNQCEITLSDTGSGALNQLISFALIEVNADSLEFNFNSNKLDLEFPTTFDGSPASSLCGNVCQCFFVATRAN